MAKKFMYGIAKVLFNDKLVGYIEKGSWNNNGSKGEATRVEAEQVTGAPVLVIPQSNGTVAPQFNIIQLDYENMQMLLGGALHYAAGDEEKTTPVGWTAPSETIQLQGPWQIDLVSGQSILIPNALLLSNLGGNLTLTETAKIECSLEPMIPEGGGAPYGTFNSDAIPSVWTSGHKLPEPAAAASMAKQADPDALQGDDNNG